MNLFRSLRATQNIFGRLHLISNLALSVGGTGRNTDGCGYNRTEMQAQDWLSLAVYLGQIGTVLGSVASRAGWPELVLERDVQWKNERNQGKAVCVGFDGL
jgi:hypothetical protein